MYHLNDLQLALRVAQLQSLSAAGRELGLTPAAASAALQRLEKKLGCQLFARSTRRLQPTEEGQLFIDAARKALGVLEEAGTALAESRGELKGEVRLALPSDLGRSLIRPWLDELMDTAPSLRLQYFFGDQLTDLIGQNLHLGLRYGQLGDSSLMRRHLTHVHRVAVASPTYLAAQGRPKSPQELSQHQVLILNRGGEPWQRWEFRDKEARLQVEVSGRYVANDGAVIRDWALAGKGIAFKSWLDVAKDVHAGRLVNLFPRAQTDSVPLQLVYLQTDYPSMKLRRVSDFLAERIQAFERAFPLI
ncbi:LysR family transcriptional regulator [Shewanella khirikhana]|uniref:HTH-type transcriptional regulator DmlR n=1 Tax=Shewanella khirikhana TaxID=1965282 RepID=A0ABM7DXB5_9GAMM|nr:LysR family transcriptional regulator [Shewanella khirikhana]AZQ13241.1 HTH-type transcriptional regulator DmlR [Shewanella khirikhana]